MYIMENSSKSETVSEQDVVYNDDTDQSNHQRETTETTENIVITNDNEESTRRILEELVQVVCRQTDLSTDEARERLEKEKYNYMKVLNDYFGIKEVVTQPKSTVNQQIYSEIRNLMDTGAKKYRMDQERNNIQ
jgi:hypothetical protein